MPLTQDQIEARKPNAFPKTFFSLDSTSKVKSITLPDEFEELIFIPRDVQKNPLEFFCNRHNNKKRISGAILTTGAGKSKLASFSACEILRQNSKMRFIIAVPQEVIGESWRHGSDEEISNFLLGKENWKLFEGLSEEDMKKWKTLRLFDSNDVVSWSINTDLCRGAGKACQTENSKVMELINFLRQPPSKSVCSRIALVSHSTLARAYKKIEKEKRLHLFCNTITCIDEFHHLYVDNNKDECNSLGELVYCLAEKGDNLNAFVWCLTGTFFRGDRRRIFGNEFNDLVNDAFYELPFDEYFKTMKFLNKLLYRFGVFNIENGYSDAIASTIASDGINKTLIFIPSRTKGESSLFPVCKKKDEIKGVLKGIVKGAGWNGEVETAPYITSDGTTNKAIFKLRVEENKWITVVDAVDDEDHIRKGVKAFLRKVNSGKDNVDIIIALGMCKEGFDWIACDRIIQVGIIKSLGVIVQVNGRMIRDFAGKNVAQMTWLFPSSSKIDKDSIAEDLNEALMTINLALMMCVDIMQPIKISVPKKDNPNEQEEISGGDLLSELFVEMDDRTTFLTMVSAKIAAIGGNISFEDRVLIVSDLLLEFGVDEDDVTFYKEAVATYTLKRAAAILSNKDFRLSLDFDSPIIREMCKEFNIVNPEDISPEGLIAFFAADAIGVSSFETYRKAVTRISMSYSEEAFNEFQISMDKFRKDNNRMPDLESENESERELAEERNRWINNRILINCARSMERE